MFESNMMDNIHSMCDNIAQINILKAIQGDSSNAWRKLVSREFTSFLDSISTVKQETTEDDAE